MISRGSEAKGKELALALAQDLGHQCIGREDLVEGATKEGIPVGKMEAAMLKPHHFTERLVLVKEHYQAFATAYLCERALEANLVYHGRAGHLLLPGVGHVLRVKVVEALEERVKATMARKNLTWEQARRYVEDVDEDIHRWVKTLYGADWNAFTHYDLTVNFENMTAKNAARALCSVAMLPEFQSTPAARKTLENLFTAARARLALARDERTGDASFRVECMNGVVTVTYRPSDTQVAAYIPDILGVIDGVRDVHATMAAANILWIQEDFERSQETYAQIVDLANRWNAAVELVRYKPDLNVDETPDPSPAGAPNGQRSGAKEYDGGIEDDAEQAVEMNDGGLMQMHDMLAKDGVAGGNSCCCGESQRLLELLNNRVKYNLVAVGKVFTSKGHATQVRMKRELIGTLSEKLRVPVIEAEELKKTYMFSPLLAVKFVLFALISAGVFVLVFTHQGAVQSFLHTDTLRGRILASVFVAILAPIFAFLYGNVAKTLLKLVNIQ